MGQRFYANPQTRREESNGAVSFAPGGPFDCVGPFAKVANCPIVGTDLRLTCYASGYADTFFSVPACTRYRGKYVSGFFTSDGMFNPVFNPHMKHWHALGVGRTEHAGPGLTLTLKTADYLRMSEPGRGADSHVREVCSEYYVRTQLTAIDPEKLHAYLRELGAWDDVELSNHYQNQHRFAWHCACNMRKGETQ